MFKLISNILSGIDMLVNANAWKKLVQRLRDHLHTVANDKLVPWDAEMLPLLSWNKIDVKKPGFFRGYDQGIYTSIYHEPLVAYARLTIGRNTVTVVKTKERELIFRHKESEIEIWLDGQPHAVYVNGSVIGPGRSSNLVARVEKSDGQSSQFAVNLGNSTAAAINNPKKAAGPNPRMLTLLRPVNPEEEMLLIALGVIVERT